jgi:glutamyl-tRNA reductase
MLVCVGLSHKQAGIAVREQLAVPGDQLPGRLVRIKSLPGVREALLLSTCNRLEIFAEVEGPAAAADLRGELGPPGATHAVLREGDEALLHLLRVAAGLESMVVGEPQILGQLKEAAAVARRVGTLGPTLTRAVARATSAGGRVRSETPIGRGAVSLSGVAAQVARKVLGTLADKSVLLVGAGEMALLAARELRADGVREVLVANRTPERAEQVAKEVGGLPVSLAELPELLERVDVAVCSTGAPRALITRELMERAAPARRYRTLFLIDLAVPRNVEPAVNELENVYVYDLDDLEWMAVQNHELRMNEVARAEAILQEELAAQKAAECERARTPVLRRLRAHAEAIASAEVERCLSGLVLSERQEKSVRAMANAIVNKLLHGPTQRLRAGAGGPLADAVAELFALGEDVASVSELPSRQAGPGRPVRSDGSVVPLRVPG